MAKAWKQLFNAFIEKIVSPTGTLTIGSAVSVEGAVTTTGALTAASASITGNVARTGQQYVMSAAGDSKVGGTAGWTVAAGDNLALVTCAASQTGAKLVIPIKVPLKVGWTITAFSIIAQIESAGGTVTLDADLRKITNAAGDPTDASVGAITQVTATADTAVSTSKSGLSEVVAAGENFYILVTATTAASTDIALQGYTLTVTEI